MGTINVLIVMNLTIKKLISHYLTLPYGTGLFLPNYEASTGL